MSGSPDPTLVALHRFGLGGRPGGPRGADALAAALGPNLELLEAKDMPLVIRHHARFYELIGARATLWRKAK